MAIAYTTEERAALDARASALLAQFPDVGSFIRRGLGPNPQAETIVYLRAALDPAPVVTKAGEFLGLMNAATRWLRLRLCKLWAGSTTHRTTCFRASRRARRQGSDSSTIDVRWRGAFLLI